MNDSGRDFLFSQSKVYKRTQTQPLVIVIAVGIAQNSVLLDELVVLRGQKVRIMLRFIDLVAPSF